MLTCQHNLEKLRNSYNTFREFCVYSFGMSEHLGDEPTSKGGLLSVARAFNALELIAQAGPQGLTLSEITSALAVSRSSAWVLLQTLVQAEFASEADAVYRRRYVLGPALQRLSHIRARNVAEYGPERDHLEALTTKIGFTSRLAILHGRDIAIVATVDAPGAIRINLHFDQPEQLHCTAVGKAVLAGLPESQMFALMSTHEFVRKTRNTITCLADLEIDLEKIRERGYSIDDQEDYEGIICVGSSVYDSDGLCIGAVSVTALKSELSIRRIDAVGKAVEETARAISAANSSQRAEPKDPVTS